MPKSELFTKLGIFIRPNFLSAELCRTLIADMVHAPQDLLGVVNGDTAKATMKISVRKSRGASVSVEIAQRTHECVQQLQRSLENHFSVTLRGCEEPQFLVYTEGDFFRPHTDGDHDSEKPEYVRQRKLSVIIFLNSAVSDERDYDGGGLVLYGLVKEPRWRNFGFQFSGEAGMLIAFPSDIIHEVQPIRRGRRCSVVSWFY